MTDELKHLQTIREIREVLRCKCHVDYTSRGTHGPDCVDYLVDDLDVAWNTRAVRGSTAIADPPESLTYAQTLATALAKKHFPQNTDWVVGDTLSLVIDQIDNITATLSRAPPKVKALAWQQMNNKPDRVQKGEWWTGKIRNCPFGWVYDVHEFKLMSGKTVYSWSRGPEAQIDVASIEEGKAAAQADYDARVRAALKETDT